MLIAIVTFQTTAETRAVALDSLLQEAPVVRAMQGCLRFQPLASPDDPASVTLLHEWASADDFAAYTGSGAFTASGAILRPLMTAPPVSRRFHAELIEAVA